MPEPGAFVASVRRGVPHPYPEAPGDVLNPVGVRVRCPPRMVTEAAMLTDAQWALLEPLVEACRPSAKVPPTHLRRTVSAIVWRHENGAKWRALPTDLGPWWMAVQTV